MQRRQDPPHPGARPADTQNNVTGVEDPAGAYDRAVGEPVTDQRVRSGYVDHRHAPSVPDR